MINWDNLQPAPPTSADVRVGTLVSAGGPTPAGRVAKSPAIPETMQKDLEWPFPVAIQRGQVGTTLQHAWYEIFEYVSGGNFTSNDCALNQGNMGIYIFFVHRGSDPLALRTARGHKGSCRLPRIRAVCFYCALGHRSPRWYRRYPRSL